MAARMCNGRCISRGYRKAQNGLERGEGGPKRGRQHVRGPARRLTRATGGPEKALGGAQGGAPRGAARMRNGRCTSLVGEENTQIGRLAKKGSNRTR